MNNYLLDTNAYFSFFKQSCFSVEEGDTIAKCKAIVGNQCYISEVTKIEIISVIGKYARGNQGGTEKCNCRISIEGEICANYKHHTRRKPLNKREIKAWLKVVSDSLSGLSPILNVSIIPLSNSILQDAEKIIAHSMRWNFGSLDAIIAATSNTTMKPSLITITSDKGLKSCMKACGCNIWDAFGDDSEMLV